MRINTNLLLILLVLVVSSSLVISSEISGVCINSTGNGLSDCVVMLIINGTTTVTNTTNSTSGGIWSMSSPSDIYSVCAYKPSNYFDGDCNSNLDLSSDIEDVYLVMERRTGTTPTEINLTVSELVSFYPNISIIFPTDNYETKSLSIDLNYSYTSYFDVSSVKYSIDKGITNTSIYTKDNTNGTLFDTNFDFYNENDYFVGLTYNNSDYVISNYLLGSHLYFYNVSGDNIRNISISGYPSDFVYYDNKFYSVDSSGRLKVFSNNGNLLNTTDLETPYTITGITIYNNNIYYTFQNLNVVILNITTFNELDRFNINPKISCSGSTVSSKVENCGGYWYVSTYGCPIEEIIEFDENWDATGNNLSVSSVRGFACNDNKLYYVRGGIRAKLDSNIYYWNQPRNHIENETITIITTTNKITIYINDSLGSESQDSVSLFYNATCTFNGLGNLTKYEIGSNTEILCEDGFTVTVEPDIDEFNVVANVPYNYTLSKLRLNYLNDSTISKKLNLPNTFSIVLDNRSWLINSSITVLGKKDGSGNYPVNATLDYNNDGSVDRYFLGELIEDKLFTDTFVVGGVDVTVSNITFNDYLYNLFYIKNSNFNYTNNITFQINGYTIDSVGIDFNENFTNTDNILTQSNVNTNMYYWMNFEEPNIGTGETPTTEWSWDSDYTSSSSGCSVFTSGETWLHNVSTGNTDDYLLQDGRTTGSCSCEYLDFCTSSIITIGKQTTNDFDLKDHSNIMLKYHVSETYYGSGGYSSYCSSYSSVVITDGNKEVTAYTTTVGLYNQFEQSASIVLNIIRTNLTVWNASVVKGGTPSSSFISLVSLDDSKDWNVMLKSSYNSRQVKPYNQRGHEGCTTIGTVKLYEMNASGISLTKSPTTGTYTINQTGTVASTNFFNPVSDIKAGIMSIDAVVPSGTILTRYLSVNSSKGYEKVSDGSLHFFTDTGNNLSWKIEMNTTSNTTSPIVTGVSVSVITSSPSNLSVDIGNDGVQDWSYTGVVNESTSPIYVSIYPNSSNTYIGDNGVANTFINKPVFLSSDTAGILQISNLNDTQDVSRIYLNNTYSETNNNTLLSFNSTQGAINVTDIQFDYVFDGNITFTIGTLSYTFQLFYSKFLESLPSGVTNIAFYPWSIKATNVVPLRQSNSIPTLNITMENLVSPANWSINLNETYDCINITVSGTNSKSDGYLMDNTSWYSIFTNKVYGESMGVWFWADYGCPSKGAWKKWSPQFSYRGCEVESICDKDIEVLG